MIAILCNIFDIMKPETWEKASSGKLGRFKLVIIIIPGSRMGPQ